MSLSQSRLRSPIIINLEEEHTVQCLAMLSRASLFPEGGRGGKVEGGGGYEHVGVWRLDFTESEAVSDIYQNSVSLNSCTTHTLIINIHIENISWNLTGKHLSEN